MTGDTRSHLLQVTGLTRQFRTARAQGAVRDQGGEVAARVQGRARATRAVDGVSFHLDTGETLAIVGESGCGKTTLARCLLGIDQPTSGSILFDGKPVMDRGRRARAYRCRHLQGIFQDPYLSLDPRWTVRRSVREILDCQHIGSRPEREASVEDLLVRVGLSAGAADRRPSALSGGQRQRAAIAAALACGPRLLIADEPVTALDMSVQAQILNLLSEMQRELRLAILLISHDLSVVRHASDRIAVMHRGRIVELASSAEILESPRHSHTQSLLAAMPKLQRGQVLRSPTSRRPPQAASGMKE
jgi:ABC-type glutathione transport system ATPase component